MSLGIQLGGSASRVLRGAVDFDLVVAGLALVGGIVRVLRKDGHVLAAADVADHRLGCVEGERERSTAWKRMRTTLYKR